MSDTNKKRTGWKQKILHEMIEYCINVLYLTVFFGVFILYRRLILAHYQITYLHYGISLIKALVFAKVIMVVSAFHFGRKLEDEPLVYPTLYKTVVFTVSMALFSLIESTVREFLRGKGLAGGWDELMGQGGYEWLAGALVVFFAFIPFFAAKELGRVMGEGKIWDVFFRRRMTTESSLSGYKRDSENKRNNPQGGKDSM